MGDEKKREDVRPDFARGQEKEDEEAHQEARPDFARGQEKEDQ